MDRYRKAVIAALAGGLAVLNALGVPVAEDLSTNLVAAINAVAAVLVYVIPNEV
jgi:hypothetical protein